MNLIDKLDAIHVRFEEVNDLLMQPEVASDRTRFVRLNREFKELQTLMEARERFLQTWGRLQEAKELLATEKDAEMRELAQGELEDL